MASGVRRRMGRAARDSALGRNVLRATDTSLAHRRETVAERPDWEDLRDRASALRGHTLDHLDRYLEEFAASARRRGVHVHFAPDARSACRIVTELARRRGCSRVLKAKSMTSEEIGLLDAFERRGWSPLETDLGEYIVQLAGEAPSHITAPALHRSAEQIRDLFREHGVLDEAGEPPADRRDLARWLSLAARRHLRAPLRDADLGVTGANFLVAETGSVVLVENEGNIRFTTTTPRIVLALAGIEKLVPKLEDLGTLLPLLTRSATGQRITTYVSMLSGGPEELHVVLLDNGRIARLADPADREVFKCIRCGACMNVCPVYRTVGGHAYGWTYPGPIGALLSPLLRGRREDHELPFASTLCGACSDVCPVRIDIHDHLLRLRARAVARGRRGLAERLAFRVHRSLGLRSRAYRRVARLARRFEGLVWRTPGGRAWRRRREPPAFAVRTFADAWREDGPPAP